ncbi:MAG: branched-chain amino acid ABC transporter permease [Epsilonproteobacteria bacterium]|nr:branched-chain amino acid ABC transporter permease [Campylobacterota bacterium]
MDLSIVASYLLIGISRGMFYFVLAAGLTLILGVLKIINFAHGSLYMLGAFFMYTFIGIAGQGTGAFFLSAVMAAITVGFISFIIEQMLLKHLYGKEHLMQMLLTYSLVLIFGDSVEMIWGTDYYTVAMPKLLSGSYHIFGTYISKFYLLFLISGLLTVVLLWLYMYKTKLGKIARAVATNRSMVEALGINADATFMYAFVIGGVLAGLGGAIASPAVNITSQMGDSIIIKVFLVVIVGGLGNIWGSLIAAIIFGISESFGVLIFPRFEIAFPFAIAAIVLILKPRGILSK